MLHIGLFEGIGGFSIAAEQMGWDTIATCEINPFGQRVLQYYWPNAYHHDDIHTFTIEKLNYELTKRFGIRWKTNDIILTGGFPCQPYSTAGKRKGKDDDRHLWPEMLRAIREIAPRYVVGENVAGLLSWNGGLVFDEVQADLEAEGYEVQPVLLPAASVGAPHRRDRIWFIAYANECTAGPSRTSGKAKSNGSKNNDEQEGRRKQTKQHLGCSEFLRAITDTSNKRLQEREQSNRRANGKEDKGGLDNRPERHGSKQATSNTDSIRRNGQNEWERQRAKKCFANNKANLWQTFPTQSPICSGNDGLSERLDGITFSKWRNESIKAYGNAIVPNVALQIFKAIEQMESLISVTPKKN